MTEKQHVVLGWLDRRVDIDELSERFPDCESDYYLTIKCSDNPFVVMFECGLILASSEKSVTTLRRVIKRFIEKVGNVRLERTQTLSKNEFNIGYKVDIATLHLEITENPTSAVLNVDSHIVRIRENGSVDLFEIDDARYAHVVLKVFEKISEYIIRHE